MNLRQILEFIDSMIRSGCDDVLVIVRRGSHEFRSVVNLTSDIKELILLARYNYHARRYGLGYVRIEPIENILTYVDGEGFKRFKESINMLWSRYLIPLDNS